MLLSCTAEYCKLNTEQSGKADSQTYKQSACHAVSKEVKSHFPWYLPTSTAEVWSNKRINVGLLDAVAKQVSTDTDAHTGQVFKMSVM